MKTPFGKYTIEKKDGGVSFMRISAKLVSAKNGMYQVKSSLGNFSVNTRKGTITKKWLRCGSPWIAHQAC